MSAVRRIVILLLALTLVGGVAGFAASLDVDAQRIAVDEESVNVPRNTATVSQSAAGGNVSTAHTTTVTIDSGTPTFSGTLSFSLFGPGSGCSGTQVGTTETVTITTANDGASFTSSGRTPTTAGTYWWLASYSGNAVNTPATSCVSITVSAPSGATKLRLSAITLTGGNRDGGSDNFMAVLRVTVVDETGALVSGVTVTGAWSPVDAAANGCTPTAANGTCSFTGNFNGNGNNGSPRTWTISGLSKSGYTYDGANNTVNTITCTRSASNNGATTCTAATL